MLLILLASLAFCTISEQSIFRSKITFEDYTTIKVPKNTYVTGYLLSSYPYYFLKSGYIHKIPKKTRNIWWDDTYGIEIEIIKRNGELDSVIEVVRDTINVPEGDTFYYGFLGDAMLVSLLFNFLF